MVPTTVPRVTDPPERFAAAPIEVTPPVNVAAPVMVVAGVIVTPEAPEAAIWTISLESTDRAFTSVPAGDASN